MSTQQWPSVPDEPSAGVPAVPVPPASEPLASRISALLPVLATLVWLIVGAVSAFLLLFSAFLFDSGGSTWTWVIVYGLLGTVLLCPVSIIAGWIAWGVTRKDQPRGSRRLLRVIAYCLPVLGILTVILGFVAIEALCGGALSCE